MENPCNEKQEEQGQERRWVCSAMFENSFVLILALTAGVGGLLFGYDTGVISGALLYIRDDFRSVERNTSLQESIVSMAVAGAVIGSAFGGWFSDRFGRRCSIMVSSVVFVAGSILMSLAPSPWVLIIGRVMVGLGVGVASIASPLYISETSPANVRGALVSINSFLITGGQFLSYLVNLAFTRVPGTWRWMVGVAAVPALLQFIFMIFLPESPRWMYRQKRQEEAIVVLEKIYPAPEMLENEVKSLQLSVEAEAEEGNNDSLDYKQLWKKKEIRLALFIGIGILIFQQFVGINTVMYYSPTIIQLAGFASNTTALMLSLIISGLNALGSVASIFLVDKSGRKKLLIFSLVGVMLSLALLGGAFYETSEHSPLISMKATQKFPRNMTCPDYLSTTRATWDCTQCIKAECGFCAAKGNKLLPGACLISNTSAKDACDGEWFTQGCPSQHGWLAIMGLALYIAFFSPGMGAVPWTINSEIYPLRYRGVCGGIAATACWASNLIVSQTFLTIVKLVGTAMSFFIFGFISLFALLFVLAFVPETKGLSFQQVDQLLQHRVNTPFRFHLRNKNTNPTDQPIANS